MKYQISFISLFILGSGCTGVQIDSLKEWQSIENCPHYIAYKISQAPVIDGCLDDAVWQNIPWTSEFRDIEGDKKPQPSLKTQAKIAWDDHTLYIAGNIQEPHVWATITQRDEVIFFDDDFEVFIDPDNDNMGYAELEVNALATAWDLFLSVPYRASGIPHNGWDIDGLKVKTQINGTINDPSDHDKGWSVEIAIPFKSLAICNEKKHYPKVGDLWRMNFSRVDWDMKNQGKSNVKIPNRPEHNWVWSPTGVINIHKPEYWGYVQFSDQKPGKTQIILDPTIDARNYLHSAYEAQSQFYKKNKQWAKSLKELCNEFPLSVPGRSIISALKIEITGDGYEMSCDFIYSDGAIGKASIRQNSHFLISTPPPPKPMELLLP